MAKTISSLTQDQQDKIAAFKAFLANGPVTKLGYAIDASSVVFTMAIDNVTILAKGTVKNVNMPATPNPLNTAAPASTEKDVIVFWNLDGVAQGNAGFSLVQILQ